VQGFCAQCKQADPGVNRNEVNEVISALHGEASTMTVVAQQGEGPALLTTTAEQRDVSNTC